MAKARGSVQVRDPKVLAGLRQARELHERAAEVEEKIDRLLDPIKDRLRELVLERDRLLYEALGARQKFFAAAKKAYPQLDTHRSLRCEVGADKAYIRWDDT
ncbi:hypothetical protein MYX77_12870, partial [Acidobacteriia bacterium AH_259_A11_L15]|nr:hypothetical protein [Acidobacteriia bacterium AH_259_A11_L15]